MKNKISSRTILLCFILLLIIAPHVVNGFYVTLLDNIGLATLVVLGLVLLTGIAGLTSFGQAAFVGIGAYTSAAMTTGTLSWTQTYPIFQSPWMGLLVGLLVTAILAFIIGSITLRLSGHYLPLGTIAWGISLYFLFGAWDEMGGQTGKSDIPAVSLFNIHINSDQSMYWLIWFCVLVCAFGLINLLNSREGRAMRALKGGRLMAEAMGINTARSRIIVFVLAALLASLSGWLYVHMQRFINPSPFSLQKGIDYLFMAVLGGASQVWGAVLGSAVIVMLQEWLQSILPSLLGRSGNFESIVFGILLIIMLQKSRDGLWPLIAKWVPVRQQQLVIDPQAKPLSKRSMPALGEVILDVQHVTRRFGGLVANDDMSLQVKAGEILALIGPNGAGKSTLFNQISGVDQPTSGHIIFKDNDVTGREARRIAALGMSRSFQHVRLLSGMSVLENVALGAHHRGKKGILAAMLHCDRKEEAQLLAEAAQQIERVGLSEHRMSAAGSLSLGQQRILEIARALASDPCLLLLDEPAAGLRLAEKKALSALIRQLRSEGMAILLVEHDMDFVMELVDRVVVMDFGQKIAEGTPEDIQRHPAVLAAYLGVSDDD